MAIDAKPTYIVDVPIEFLEDFQHDPLIAWQSFGDRPLQSELPYFEDLSSLYEMVKPRKNPFDHETFSFDGDFICNDTFLRWVHIDLGQKRDACGIAMCHVPKMLEVPVVKVGVGGHFTDRELQPYYYFDFLGRIVAGKGEEVIFSQVRELLYELEQRGFPIALVTYDRFQSVDSIQILRNRGFTVDNLSMDATASFPVVEVDAPNHVRRIATGGGKFARLSAWATAKEAIRQRRVDLPTYWVVTDTTITEYDQVKGNVDDFGNRMDGKFELTWVVREATQAIYDSQKMKVHEPPVRGTIDLLEAVCGALFNARNNVMDVEEERPITRVESIRSQGRPETIMDEEDMLDDDFTDRSSFEEDEGPATKRW